MLLDAFLGELTKIASIEYRGTTFPGYNKPIPSNRAGKRRWFWSSAEIA